MIRDVPDPDFLLIPDPGVKKAPESWIRNTTSNLTEEVLIRYRIREHYLIPWTMK
jgi:hypothetical protein